MLGQGRFPVGIGLSDSMIEERTKRGVPIAILDPRQLKEGTPTTPASGALSLVNRAPHPNAAKLYINWLLAKSLDGVGPKPQDTSVIVWMCRRITPLPGRFRSRIRSRFTMLPPRK